MYGVIVNVMIDEKRISDAEKTLIADVVPMVKSIPGAISGNWFEPAAGRGTSFILFDTEANAKAAAENIPNSPMPDFVKLESVDVREVIAKF